MSLRPRLAVAALALAVSGPVAAFAQTPAPAAPAAAPAALPPLLPGQTNDPFPQLIIADRDVIAVTARDFAVIPDQAGEPARMMTLVDEPGSRRLWLSDMAGVLYTISPDGKTVTPYVDLRDARWGAALQAQGRERGIQSFAVHPQFAQAGTPGFGKFYTYIDTTNQAPAPDFTTPHPTTTHDVVLLEWTAKSATAASYDGGAPREMMRFRKPFANHNGGAMAFNPTARAGSADYGLLYISVADGGSGGDPMHLSQNRESIFGKIIRIDPLGRNGANGKYGVPASNPFVGAAGVRPEIYAIGVRNSQRLGWDAKDGAMYLSDIGQNIVEEVSAVPAGGNLGWNTWEGSYRFVSTRAVELANPRSEPGLVWPIVEWSQLDPILQANNQAASVGVVFNRGSAVPQLNNRMIFGDMPSGEMFHVDADNLPQGGQDPLRRVLFKTPTNATPRTFKAIVQERNVAQGKPPAERVDLRFDADAKGRVFLLNKYDGVLRVIER
jgi:glucose/arabinose dehydrogenase